MEASNKQWLDAFNTPSIASFPAMYTEDAVLIPGGMASAVPGPVEITKFWEGSIRAGFKDHTFEIVETRADGNLAYVLSSWTVKKVGGGPNNNEESTLQGHTLLAGAFETERRHLEDQSPHIRSASGLGAARSQEVNRLDRIAFDVGVTNAAAMQCGAWSRCCKLNPIPTGQLEKVLRLNGTEKIVVCASS